MQTFKTISGREIKISSNKRNRTFTIKTESSKFRTVPMNKEEFENNQHNTGNDWQQFLNGCDGDYYTVR